MSHIDDGALHAYLDGALDALPASEGARIREHLAACDVCAARLEEERALRAEAHAILSGADPGFVPAASMEDLRGQARARRRARPGVRLQRLTWAASVVLAAGAGWMLRESQGPSMDGPGILDERVEPDVVAQDPAATASTPSEPPARAALEADAGPTPSTTAPSAAAPSAGAPVVTAPETSLLARREAREVGDAQRALTASRERVAAVVASGVEPVRTDEAPGQRVEGVRAALDLAKMAAEGAGAPVTVPGLPILGIGQGGDGFPDGTVRVLQLLEGDTLELIQLPSGASAPMLAGRRADGRTEWVVPYAGGWLLGRGRVTASELQALLARATGSGGG